jgi:MFS family permease
MACLALVCTQAGLIMYSPSIPFLLKAFNTGYTRVAYTMTAYVLGYALSMFCMGGLSDQWGRKKSYLVVMSIFSVASLLLAITSSIDVFIVLRLLQGLGGGGCAVIARASVRDVFEGKALVKGMSYLSIAFYFSMGIFQYMGGVIQVYASYKIDFLFMFLFSLSLLVVIVFYFSETHYQSKNTVSIRQFIADYGTILREKYLILMALGGGIGYAVLLAFNIMGAFYLQECLHVSPATIGEIGLCLSMSYIVGSALTNYLVKSFNIDFLISMGKTILFIACLLSLVSAMRPVQTVFYVVSPIMLGIAGQAMLFPCAMTKAIGPYKNMPGAASSLFGFTQQLSGFIISALLGWLPYQHILWFGGTVFLIGLISFVLLTPRFLRDFYPIKHLAATSHEI